MVGGTSFVIDGPVLCDEIPILQQIPLTAVQDLDILARMRRLRERLHHSMVGDGNGPVAPFLRGLHHALGIVQSIHSTHLGMSVKFDTFLRIGVHPFFFLRFFNAVRHDHGTVIKPVPLSLALDLDAVSCTQIMIYIVPFLIDHECLDANTCPLICHEQSHQLAVALGRTGILFEQLPFDADDTTLRIDLSDG